MMIRNHGFATVPFLPMIALSAPISRIDFVVLFDLHLLQGDMFQ
jgi:hypothetical protein